MGAAVGVHVVAEHQPAVEPGQPVGDRRHLGEQVDAGLRRAGVDRRQQRARAGLRCPRSTRCPDAGARQVDRRDRGAPAQQAGSGPISAPAPSTATVRPVEAQPLGVRGHLADGVGGGRLQHAGARPRVELGVQVGAAQPPAAVRAASSFRLARAVDLDGLELPVRGASASLASGRSPSSVATTMRACGVQPGGGDRGRVRAARPASTRRRKCRR